jgi:hypothetical protein
MLTRQAYALPENLSQTLGTKGQKEAGAAVSWKRGKTATVVYAPSASLILYDQCPCIQGCACPHVFIFKTKDLLFQKRLDQRRFSILVALLFHKLCKTLSKPVRTSLASK